MKRHLVACLLSATVAACATPRPAAQQVSWQDVEKGIPPGLALVYFVRPTAVLAGLQTYAISVNGTRISEIKTGYYFAYALPPGMVRVSARTARSVVSLLVPTFGSPTLDLDTHAGEISFVKIGVNFFGGPTLEKLDSEQGKTTVSQAEAQPHDGKTGWTARVEP
jgi:hypothetical protein